MPPRLFVDRPLRADDTFALPPGPARHVQVLRLQPGAALTLFNGEGGEWAATVTQMGRSDVTVQLGAHADVSRELPLHVTLALGMPANERMDAVVEKATELGVAAIQPLMCERSVLRLAGERAQKKVAHWQSVALSACEQSGRTRVPRVAEVCTLSQWLQALPSGPTRWMLSLREARSIAAMPSPTDAVLCLSGPEGGLSPAEELAAAAAGFAALSLGPRVLRADTAPLALLAHLGLIATS
ncbi:MAG: 16S rRNA (uracil(1498)-N(3))-methyltransferase [Burkholderiales bacterium]